MNIEKLEEPITISEFLRIEGFFSKDLKQKIENKQMTLSGDFLTLDDLKRSISHVYDAGDFIFYNLDFYKENQIISFSDMFEVDIPKYKNIFKDLFLLKAAKKKQYVIKIIQ